MTSFVSLAHAEDKTGKELCHVRYSKTENKLSVKNMEVGEPTREALKIMSSEEQKYPLLGMKSFFHEVSKYLLSHLPLDSEMLQDLVCLHPLCQKKSKTPGANQKGCSEVATSCFKWRSWSIDR